MSSTPVARPAKVAHVVYRTRRYDEMLAWYQTVFNARVQFQNPALAFLTFDDEHHRFAFANMSVLQPSGADTDRQGAIGVDHLGYSYASLPELLENYALLKAQGITPYWCVHHGIAASLYYADPDGNQMEFQVDCLHSGSEAAAFMESNFAANPVGIEFDPEDWLTKLRAGLSESEILTRAEGPASPIRGSLAAYLSA
ncbi:MAG: VOC family protein [Bryobacteraceae bacterium]|nr:VOC family protein [Bryobacteraceae bacterium]